MLLSFLRPTATVFGEENSEQVGLKVTISPELPTNQLNRETGYFDLLMAPSAKQDIYMLVENISDNKVKIKATVNQAKTNSLGVVDYSPKLLNYQKDQSMKIALADIAKIEQENIEIPANGSYRLKVSLNMPEKSFAGMLLGGIYFQQLDEEEQVSGNIHHTFSTMIALMLRETIDPIAEKVNLLKSEIGQTDNRNAFKTTIQNASPTLLQNFELSVKVKDKRTNKIVHQNSGKNMQMAPNTQMVYDVSLNGKPFKAGNYHVDVQAKTKTNHWNFSKEITITRKQANRYNKKDPTVKEDNVLKYLLIVGIIALIILIALIIYGLFIRRGQKSKRKRKSLKQQDKRKQKKHRE